MSFAASPHPREVQILDRTSNLANLTNNIIVNHTDKSYGVNKQKIRNVQPKTRDDPPRNIKKKPTYPNEKMFRVS